MPRPESVPQLRPALRRAAALVATALVAAAAGPAPASGTAAPAPRPNILWISAEDISAGTLGCYGGAARTPRLDALAAAGLRFDAAFSAAPVCAPSRSAIITGIMPTTLGSLPMRCRATPPPQVVGFPKLLAAAGYFCTNNAKTDYNLASGFAAGWSESSNEAHWRHRPNPGQPFFAVFNLGVTHESSLFTNRLAAARARLSPEERRDPAEVAVPPFYPDTPGIRGALAARLELAALLDRDVGRILDELAADGLADDTIVFFWGDHGEGVPHGKRSLNEHGLRVPLLVRVPPRFASRATLPDGGLPAGATATLVSLLDLGPTVLDLAGLPVPAWMEGRSFLGPQAAPADVVIGARDRMDATAGFGRTVRDGRFRYVRNFLPWLDGDDLPVYADGVAITGELREARTAGTLPPGADWFGRSSRTVEELYDTAADPECVVDLAADPARSADLARLRERLRAWMRQTRDTGVLPEPLLRREAAAAGSEWAIFHPAAPGTAEDLEAAARHEALLAAAWHAADGADAGTDAAAGRLSSAEPGVRFWAACGAGWAARRDEPRRGGREVVARLDPLLGDPEPVVRIAAARWLMGNGGGEPAAGVLTEGMRSTDPEVRLAALVAIDELGLDGRPLWTKAAALEPGKAERYAADIVGRIRGWLDRGTTHRGR